MAVGIRRRRPGDVPPRERESRFQHRDAADLFVALPGKLCPDQFALIGVKEDAIAIKTSEKDDLEGRGDLLNEECSVEWIITKAALQEG